MSHQRHKNLSPIHQEHVATLVSEGWKPVGFRADLLRALARRMGADQGVRVASFDCGRFDRCECSSDEGEWACPWEHAREVAPTMYIRPDAHRIDAETRTAWIAEVNVTHHAGAEKWAQLWFDLDAEGWTLRLMIVDRNGTRSEPFGESEMADALYAELAS